MDIITMIEQTNSYKNKKEIFSELSDKIYQQVSEVKISTLKNINILETIKTLQVIELDNLESFIFYLNYDHFLIFKFQGEFYFCDTELVPSYNGLLKLSDFNYYLRKDKIHEINKISS